MVKTGWILIFGILLGVLFSVWLVRFGPVFGQPMPGPMGSMTAQMTEPQGMGDMMIQMMREPESMRAMAAGCAQAMKDPAVQRSMQEAMNDPEMRKMMQQMLELMNR